MTKRIPKYTPNTPLYDMPSGMGGSFTVRILDTLEDGKVQVQIWMPGNPDFHKHLLTTSRDRLTEARR